MAAGSAQFERRLVRIRLITMFDPSEDHQILTVTHTYRDVLRSNELAGVWRLGMPLCRYFSAKIPAEESAMKNPGFLTLRPPPVIGVATYRRRAGV